MPVISRFLGIAIAILYRDHDPPHFHATYGEHQITVGIRDGAVAGRFPQRAQGHVLEWLALHRAALLEDWELARAGRPLKPIPPLE
jgi:hypothetical protein